VNKIEILFATQSFPLAPLGDQKRLFKFFWGRLTRKTKRRKGLRQGISTFIQYRRRRDEMRGKFICRRPRNPLLVQNVPVGTSHPYAPQLAESP